MNNKIRSVLGLLVLCGQISLAIAEEIKLTHNNLTLNANLEIADGKTINDRIVVMTHGTLAHNKMEIMNHFQDLFKANGISTLSINLGLGLNDRKGMYDCATTHTHKHTDAVDEIGVWVNWLKAKGADDLVLLGHSRGGNQTAWYAAENSDSAVKKVILIAPATWDEEYAKKAYKKRYKKDLDVVLEKAEALVKQGKGASVMKDTDHIYCENTSVTADSFISYNKPDQRFDTPSLLKKIKVPVLVFAGSEDKVVANLEEKVSAIVEEGKIELSVIDGAGHMFRDLYAEDVMDQIVEYLEK